MAPEKEARGQQGSSRLQERLPLPRTDAQSFVYLRFLLLNLFYQIPLLFPLMTFQADLISFIANFRCKASPAKFNTI